MGWKSFYKHPRLVRIADIFATGTASATTYLRGDGSWSTPAGGSVTSLTKVMTADQSINSSTTLTNVTDLVFAIGANETWCYTFSILAGDHLDLTGFQLNYTAPAGATGWIFAGVHTDGNDDVYGEVAGSSVNNTMDFLAGFPVGFTKGIIRASISIINGGTAGNIQVQFAQSTSDATNLTFKQGSFGVGNKV